VHILQDKHVLRYVTILRVHGPLPFGTTDKLAEATEDPTQFKPGVILRLRNMAAIDVTGLHALEQLPDRLRGSGRTLLRRGADRAREVKTSFDRLGKEIARDLQQAAV